MRDKKLLNLLKGFSIEEFKKLSDFIKSPYYEKKSDNLVKLYRILKPHHPTFESDLLLKEKVFTKIYKRKEFNSSLFANLTSKFIRIVEDYYVLLAYQKNEQAKKRHLIQIFGERNLYELFRLNSGKLLEDLDKQPVRGTKYYKERYLLEKEIYAHICTTEKMGKGQFLKAAHENLHYFFALENLRIGADMKNRENLYVEKANFDSESTTFQTPLGNKTVELFKKVIQLLEHKKNEDFFSIKEFLEEYTAELDQDDQCDILMSLINHAVKQLSSGEMELKESIIDLFDFGLKSKLLLSNGVLSGKTFLNITGISAGLKKFDWSKNIIEEYQNFLEPSTKVAYLILGKAFWHFHKKDYEIVVSIANDANFSDLNLSIQIRILMLRACFEFYSTDKTYNQLGQNSIKTFEKYLKRNITYINEKTALAYLNFAYLYKKLIKIQAKPQIKIEEVLKLEEEFIDFNSVAVKNWLIQKLEELKKKAS